MKRLTIGRPLDPGNPPERLILDHPSISYQSLQLNVAGGLLTMLTRRSAPASLHPGAVLWASA